ncbi:MAG: hypothetical protein ACOZHQ_04475 [Thermodesulfobacteriota bacterium]
MPRRPLTRAAALAPAAGSEQAPSPAFSPHAERPRFDLGLIHR